MISINLLEVNCKKQIAKVIKEKMELNGIKKQEIIDGTHLSKSAINSVLRVSKKEKDYRFETLLRVLSFMKIQIFIGKNNEVNSKVLTLF